MLLHYVNALCYNTVMINANLATLKEICAQAGILPRKYAQLHSLHLVPGWLRSKSLGRGLGRKFYYDRDEALRCIQIVHDEMKKGKSLDEISRKHARHWFGKGNLSLAFEYEEEQEIGNIIKNALQITDRVEQRIFQFVVTCAFEKGAFSDFSFHRSGSALLVRVHEKCLLDDLTQRLREILRVYTLCGPGNAVQYALSAQALQNLELNPPNCVPEEEETEEVRMREVRRWEDEKALSRKEMKFWSEWPKSRSEFFLKQSEKR